MNADALVQEIARLRPHYQSQTATDIARRQMLDHFERFAAESSAPALAGENVEAVARLEHVIGSSYFPNKIPDKVRADLDTLSRLQAPKDGTDSRDETITNYSKTVSRIWDALGVTTYEEAGGKHIHELVADLKARVDQLDRNNTGLWENYTRVLAERDRLETALRKIAAPLDCGCKPCTGQCKSQFALMIEVQERQDIATEALAQIRQVTT